MSEEYEALAHLPIPSMHVSSFNPILVKLQPSRQGRRGTA